MCLCKSYRVDVMAEVLQEAKSLLQTGDTATLDQFNRRKDVKDFYYETRREPGCQILKVSNFCLFCV